MNWSSYKQKRHAIAKINDPGARTRERSVLTHLGRLAAILGMAAAGSMLGWLILGSIGAAPSMIDVFGFAGMRIPAGIAIGGLLLAAVGLNDF